MPFRLILLALFFAPSLLIGQYLNVYSSVSAINACTGRLAVPDTSGFFTGQRVLLMQMQGAIIDESNNSNFGAILSLEGAGLVEVHYVDSISATEVFLEHYPDRRFEANAGLQLISFPEFDTLIIQDTLKLKEWDGNTGGVLAFTVTGLLELRAPIIADGCGFRGGRSISLSNNCVGGFNSASGYYYASDNFRGAEKGEGIAPVIISKENGRGAQANGGGGGNDHNTGGAGGGHLSSGGDGGERDLPFFTTSCKGDYPGKKGRPIPFSTSARMFLGGGGGAGHGNNDVGTDGGDGGGIVIIQAAKTLASGQKISSNGNSALDTEAGDGAGGGGAGGQLLLSLGELSDELSIEATGGNGGSANNKGDDSCFGPGGGGAGGTVALNFTGPGNILQNLNAGLPGITFNTSNGCNGSNNGAEAGEPGTALSFEDLREPDIEVAPLNLSFNGPDSLVLCEKASIEILTEGYLRSGFWEWNTGAGFIPIPGNAGFTRIDSTILHFDPENIGENSFTLRFQGIDYCEEGIISEIIAVKIIQPLSGDFSYQEDGLEVSFTASIGNSDGFVWDFGDGTQSNEQNPTHTYNAPGLYPLELTLFNACDTVSIRKTLVLGGIPMAGIDADEVEGCSPLNVQFSSRYTGPGWSYEWIMPGANPAFSDQANPLVTYDLPGLYSLQLIVEVNGRADTIRNDDYITVLASPEASFQWDANGLDVEFEFTGTGDLVNWEFGDGNSSDLRNPMHTYTMPGTYSIIVNASNACGSDSHTLQITVGRAPVAGGTVLNKEGCSPLTATWTDRSSGQTSRLWVFEGGQPATSNDSVVQVRYQQAGIYDALLVVENSFGTDSILFPDAIEVTATPTVDFSFSANGLLVNFENLSSQANNYRWNFGDGSAFSGVVNPEHEFPAAGQYFVTLEGINEDCSASLTRAVNVLVNSTVNNGNEKGYWVYPNPFSSSFFIKRSGKIRDGASYNLYDFTGKLIQHGHLGGDLTELLVHNSKAGFYLLAIQTEEEVVYFPLVQSP
jgi:PKD repeat protein